MWIFLKRLASNAQKNSDIKKHQLPGNGAKNLIDIGSIEVLIFIYPKHMACRRVLGVSSVDSWVSSIGIQFERLNLGRVKQEEKVD